MDAFATTFSELYDARHAALEAGDATEYNRLDRMMKALRA